MSCCAVCCRLSRNRASSSSELARPAFRRSYGRRYRPKWNEENQLMYKFPKLKDDARPVARLFPNYVRVSDFFDTQSLETIAQITYADGSKGMQMTTVPRPTVTYVRDITNHPLWVFAGESKGDTSDMSGQLGRFARRLGGQGGVEGRQATASMFEDIMAEAGEAPEVLTKKVVVKAAASTPGKKGKKK